MESGFDQKNWLDYVTKLNDRGIRRNSSNGLTVWALIGVNRSYMRSIVQNY